jgi:hypothetical protein
LAFLLFCSAHVCRKSRRNRECTQVANPKRIEGEALSVLNGARAVMPSAEYLAFC